MNPVLELTIDDVAFGGKGVARTEGMAVFVPFTIPGEQVKARVLRRKKRYAEAELISIGTPSPDRVEPQCPYFGRCGGCSYQHVAYERQLALKARQVEQTLRRVGRLEHVPMRPAVPAPEPYGYRNRIRVHVAGGVIGFFAQESNALIDVAECPISRPELNAALRRLRASFPQEGDYSLRAPGGGGPFFEQTHSAIAREMVELLERSVRRGQDLVVDAYCGAGLFAKHLAPLFTQVIGIEANEFAVAHAQRTAAAHERYLAGEVEAHLGEILTAHDAEKTTLILDPPATGISPRVADLVVGARPVEVFYVSCNPATLARDLALLSPTYHLEGVTPLDMFPQTAEIEVVAHLTYASTPAHAGNVSVAPADPH